jgi:hypothetical protein
MIYLVAQDKRGASALRLATLLEMRYDTVWHILQKIKMAMASRDQNITLGGFIEIDEGFFGGASKGRGNRGRGSKKKQPVIVMVESLGKRAGRIKMQIVSKVNMPAIQEATRDKFDPNSHFKADGWGAYGILSAEGHKVQIKPMTKEELQDGHHWVHIAISNARAFILGTYHGVSGHRLQRYLDEFCYRWNRRESGNGLFSKLLTACAFGDPVSYSAVTG